MKWNEKEEQDLMNYVSLYKDDMNFAFNVASTYLNRSVDACKAKYKRSIIAVSKTKVEKKQTFLDKLKSIFK